MLYRQPEAGDKEILKEYVREHLDHGESSISASLGLSSSGYSEWLDKIRSNASHGDEQWGRSLLYLCFDNGQLIGLLSIRFELPKLLSEKYGDIGYGVRPSQRRRGYASEMLRFALTVCKDKGLKSVILGCYKDNPTSAAVIKKNGGVLIAENDNYTQGRISRYYLIELQ